MKFLMKQKKRSAVSPVIATLLLIAIAVAAAIIVYAFVTGLIGGLTTSSNGLVVISGSLTVPGGSGAGTLVATIKNSASNPISAITITTDGGDTGVTATYAQQNGYAAGQQVNAFGSANGAAVFCASGITTPVACTGGTGSSLPIGQTVSAIATTAGASAGTTYTFTISVYFTGSASPTIQTFSVTAQV